MGSRSATQLLQLPVQLRGIRLGRPVDLLLDDVEFYRGRARSFRALLGGGVVSGRGELGRLRDVLLEQDGTVAALLVEQGDGIREVEPAGVKVEHVSAA